MAVAAEAAAAAPEATAAPAAASQAAQAAPGAVQRPARRRSSSPPVTVQDQGNSAPPPAPRNYALLQGQTRSGFGAVVWTLVVAYVAILLVGLILIPGRSGRSGAGALAQVLSWFDDAVRSLISTQPFFVPKGASG